MVGEDSNVIFPEIEREDYGDQMGTGYVAPGGTAKKPGPDAMEMTMRQMNEWDMGSIFHEIPDGQKSTGTGKYPTSALDAQVIPSAESPDGPSWSKHYIQD
jgi:hypothetical protein